MFSRLSGSLTLTSRDSAVIPYAATALGVSVISRRTLNAILAAAPASALGPDSRRHA